VDRFVEVGRAEAVHHDRDVLLRLQLLQGRLAALEHLADGGDPRLIAQLVGDGHAPGQVDAEEQYRRDLGVLLDGDARPHDGE
jgi:hypothetical protein